MKHAVAVTLGGIDLSKVDTAAAGLARLYAAVIDESPRPEQALADYGPKLLAVLVQLGATPAARSAVAKGGAPVDNRPSGRDALAALRARRQAQAGA